MEEQKGAVRSEWSRRPCAPGFKPRSSYERERLVSKRAAPDTLTMAAYAMLVVAALRHEAFHHALELGAHVVQSRALLRCASIAGACRREDAADAGTSSGARGYVKRALRARRAGPAAATANGASDCRQHSAVT